MPDQQPGAAQVDTDRIEAAVREILIAIGEDPDRDGLRETPARVGRMYADRLGGLHEHPEPIFNAVFEAPYDELVLIRDIRLYSFCEHHLVPFFGAAHVGYVPHLDGKVAGLSKIGRLVDLYSRRPQVQERLTTEIAEALEVNLEPSGVIVVIEAEHLCMSMRGIRQPGTKTVTSAVRGILRTDPKTRSEAMSLILQR